MRGGQNNTLQCRENVEKTEFLAENVELFQNATHWIQPDPAEKTEKMQRKAEISL